MAGSSLARAPVARITALACSVRSPTTTLGAGLPLASRASPMITSIPFFFIRKATPEFSCLATLRERSITLAKSKAGFSAERP